MSRHANGAHALRFGFPRVSGDEPGRLICGSYTNMFSPRERG